MFSRMARRGRLGFPSCTSVSMRVRVAHTSSAWTVNITPSWPVLAAVRMAAISGPRASPSQIRSGFMRSACRTRSAIVTASTPSACSRVTNWTQFGTGTCSSGVSSMVITRSSSSSTLPQALRKVVLPEAVPPLTTMFSRARTAASTNLATASSIVPSRTISESVLATGRNRRMVTTRLSRLATRGGMMPWNRLPSSSRPSAQGVLVERPRWPPARSSLRLKKRRSSAPSVNRRGVRSLGRPARTTQISSGPLMKISSTVSSVISSASGPQPRMSSTTRFATTSGSAGRRGRDRPAQEAA